MRFSQTLAPRWRVVPFSCKFHIICVLWECNLMVSRLYMPKLFEGFCTKVRSGKRTWNSRPPPHIGEQTELNYHMESSVLLDLCAPHWKLSNHLQRPYNRKPSKYIGNHWNTQGMQGLRTRFPETWKTNTHSPKIDDLELDTKYWSWPKCN